MKDKYCKISRICGVKKKKKSEFLDTDRLVAVRGGGGGGGLKWVKVVKSFEFPVIK